MSVSTRDVLNYAFTLVENDGADEVVLRNAVGRAYYAAFNHTINFNSIIPHYIDDAKCGVHQQKINQLKTISVANDLGITAEVARSIKKLGLILADMKVKRTLADYVMDADLNIDTATHVCEQAKKFIASCDEVLSVLSAPAAEAVPA